MREQRIPEQLPAAIAENELGENMNESQTSPSPGGQRSWIFQVLTIGVVLAFVGLPIFLNGGLKSERAQWNAARAVRIFRSGQQQTAIEMLTVAAANSDDPMLDIQLAQWQKELNDCDSAIKICDSILEQFGVDSGQERTVEVRLDAQAIGIVREAFRLKAECLILKDQKELALLLISELGASYDTEEQNTPARKNEMAYFRALCGRELKQAERDIRSVVYRPRVAAGLDRMSFTSQVCFSIGLVARYTDQREMAVKSLSNRIEELKLESESFSRKVNLSLYHLMKRFVPLDSEQYSQSNNGRKQMELVVDELAILRAVKALLLEELGQSEAASDERHRIAELNRDAETLLNELPSDRFCLNLLSMGAQYLDTSGYVHAVQGNRDLALRELNVAVTASEILLKSTKTSLQNTAERVNTGGYLESARKTCAVIHNHRMQVYEAESRLESAVLDKARIVELEFEPGDDLF